MHPGGGCLGLHCLRVEKKYIEAEKGRLEAIGRGNAWKEELVSAKNLNDRLATRLSGLLRDTAELGRSIRRYETLLNANLTEQEKLNALLTQKVVVLDAREPTIQELQDLIEAQNQKVRQLLGSVKEALKKETASPRDAAQPDVGPKKRPALFPSPGQSVFICNESRNIEYTGKRPRARRNPRPYSSRRYTPSTQG